MAYQSLYRKYRPQTFSDVVGQGHVVRTLQNALASGRIAHGYLFTGTRGTAKTTVARLLAKALNCESADHPVAEPCNACDACKSIAAGTCIDVIEMDAASHRGVADIEEVRKAVGYGPMQFRYKVFIIDEAHQLSSDAKDAFLKTLEEPPPGVVFVLATTEPQAIPITIRSRCQQFDFKRGSLADIAARLRYVLDCEGVAYTPEAVSLVARGAEGSYRDSLSLLEQVLAFTPTQVSASDVETVLGALDAENLARLTEAIAGRDAPGALALAGEMLDAGKEARTLLRTLAGHFRDLLLVRIGGPAAAQEMTVEEAQRLQAPAAAFAPEQLIRAMDVVNEAQNDLRWNNQHRLLVELTFLKLMQLGESAGQPYVTAPIVFTEKAPTPAAAPPTPRPAPVAPPTPQPQPVAVAPMPPPAPQPEPELDATFFTDDADEEDAFEPDTIGVVGEPEPEAEPVAATPAPAAAPSLFGDDEGPSLFDDEPEPTGMASLFDEPAPEPVAEKPAAAPQPVVAQPESVEDEFPPLPEDEEAFAPPPDDPDPEPAPIVAAPTPKPVVEKPVPPPPPPAPEPEQADPRITLEKVRTAWPRFLFDAEKVSKQASVMLADALPTSVEGKTVILTFGKRASYEMMQLPKKQEFIRKLLARSLAIEEGSVPVRLKLDENVPPSPQRGIQRTRVRYDPMAALDALVQTDAQAPAPGWTPPPPPRFEAPRPEPAAARPELRRPEPVAAATALPPGYTPEDAAPALSGDAVLRAALNDPLIQEVLTTFGGELIA